MKFILLVTLYNCDIQDSSTITSFVNSCYDFFQEVEIFLWDNSTSNPSHDFNFLNSVKYKYYKSEVNEKLSVVYNSVLKSCAHADFLINFDQDSSLTPEYFLQLKRAIRCNNKDCAFYIPLIYHQTKCVSPGKMSIFKNLYITNPLIGRTKSHKILAITSGTCIDIKAAAAKDLWYDEHLSLYGVDMKFSIDYYKKFQNLYILNYRLKHDLSMFSREETKQKRSFRLTNEYKSDLYLSKFYDIPLLRRLYIHSRFLYKRFRIFLIK